MSFPKLTPTEILKVLKVANLKVVRDMNRRVITDDIYNADADKVLDFIIKVRSFRRSHPQQLFSELN